MLQKVREQAERGFTIIEVMIVLAIAGLILVVVLVAIPQLQSSQRDSSRRDVANRYVAEVGNYSTNNNGRIPVTAVGAIESSFNSNYLATVELVNPSTGNSYSAVVAGATTDNPSADQIMMYPGMTCQGEGVTGSLSNTARVYAVRVQLDSGTAYYCADNN